MGLVKVMCFCGSYYYYYKKSLNDLKYCVIKIYVNNSLSKSFVFFKRYVLFC